MVPVVLKICRVCAGLAVASTLVLLAGILLKGLNVVTQESAQWCRREVGGN